MNDRFKFRAYDPTKKIMLDPFSLTELWNLYGTESNYGNENKQLFEYGYDSSNDFPIIMQFTGLTDKNGNEIYESDYVNVTVPEANGLKEHTFEGQEIVWQKETASFAVGLYSHTMNDDLIYEVVGNKYEK